MAEQIEVKNALTRVLRRTLSSIADDDYRLMDTGDGAAVGFLADPEHALYFALAIDAACREEHHALGLGPGTLRIGINLGPVKDVLDVNDRPSLIGDGMNTAQRIVSFAKPGQITISRSFFELVSRLAPEYSGIFVHIGTHDDKHGREHDVYVINPSKEILDKIQERLQLTVAEATGMNVVFKARPDGIAAPAPASASTVEPPRPVLAARPQPDRAAAPALTTQGTTVTAVATVPDPSNAGAPATAASSASAAPPRFRLLPIAITAGLLLGATVILTPLLTKRSTQAVAPAISPPAASVPAAPARSDGAPTKAPPTGGSTSPNTGTTAGSPPNGKDSSSSGAVVAAPTTASAKGSASPTVAAVPEAPPASPSTNATRDTTAAKRNAHPVAQPVTGAGAGDKANATTRSAPAAHGANAGSRGTYSRCSALMQKMSLGESLTPAERQEMEQFCR